MMQSTILAVFVNHFLFPGSLTRQFQRNFTLVSNSSSVGSALIFSPLCSVHSYRHGDILLNDLPVKEILNLFFLCKGIFVLCFFFAVFFKHSLALSAFGFCCCCCWGKRDEWTQLLMSDASPGASLTKNRERPFLQCEKSTRTCDKTLTRVLKNHNLISFAYSLLIYSTA